MKRYKTLIGNKAKLRQKCCIEGCERIAISVGYCDPHYQRYKKGTLELFKDIPLPQEKPKKCKAPDCSETHLSSIIVKGYCQKHYTRIMEYDDLTRKVKNEPGEGWISGKGYRMIGIKFEHRIIMEQNLGRPLLKTENVHHINGDKLDNRIENLELWSKHQPSGQRVTDKVKWAKELLALYDNDPGTNTEDDMHCW